MPDFSKDRFGLGVFALLAELHGLVVAVGWRGGILEIQAEVVQHEACDDDYHGGDDAEKQGVGFRGFGRGRDGRGGGHWDMVTQLGAVRDAASPPKKPPPFSRVDCEIDAQPQRYRVVLWGFVICYVVGWRR